MYVPDGKEDSSIVEGLLDDGSRWSARVAVWTLQASSMFSETIY